MKLVIHITDKNHLSILWVSPTMMRHTHISLGKDPKQRMAKLLDLFNDTDITRIVYNEIGPNEADKFEKTMLVQQIIKIAQSHIKPIDIKQYLLSKAEKYCSGLNLNQKYPFYPQCLSIYDSFWDGYLSEKLKIKNQNKA